MKIRIERDNNQLIQSGVIENLPVASAGQTYFTDVNSIYTLLK